MSPEEAVRAMDDLTKAVRENTATSKIVGKQLFIFNQIMLGVSQKQGGAAMVKLLLESAARMFSRSG